VEFNGAERDYLMEIKSGVLPYEDLLRDAERRKLELDELTKTSTIPDDINKEKIDILYNNIINLK
jgi:hypothetical protein